MSMDATRNLWYIYHSIDGQLINISNELKNNSGKDLQKVFCSAYVKGMMDSLDRYVQNLPSMEETDTHLQSHKPVLQEAFSRCRASILENSQRILKQIEEIKSSEAEVKGKIAQFSAIFKKLEESSSHSIKPSRQLSPPNDNPDKKSTSKR